MDRLNLTIIYPKELSQFFYYIINASVNVLNTLKWIVTCKCFTWYLILHKGYIGLKNQSFKIKTYFKYTGRGWGLTALCVHGFYTHALIKPHFLHQRHFKNSFLVIVSRPQPSKPHLYSKTPITETFLDNLLLEFASPV